MLSSHGGFLTIAMYHHRETIFIKLTHYDETEKRAHDSQRKPQVEFLISMMQRLCCFGGQKRYMYM